MSTKNIAFKIRFEGSGILNYDAESKEHKDIMYGNNFSEKNNDNSKFAKKQFFFDKDGKLEYKIKISSNSVRHNLFKDTYAINPAVFHTEAILMDFIASSSGLLRGWVFTKADTGGFKRDTAVVITDLVQVCNAKSHMDFHSNSGYKTKNSIFKKETIGHTVYEAKGYIKIDSLQFLSLDNCYDRNSMDGDLFPLFEKIIKMESRFPQFSDKPKPYKLKDGVGSLSEYGVLFSNDFQNYLVRTFFGKLSNLKMSRGANAFGEVTSLKIKELDSDNYKFISEDGWVDYDADYKDFDFHSYYEETDLEEYRKFRLVIDPIIAKDLKESKDAKKAATDRKNEIKEAKKKKTNEQA
jgi:hypothetical protein